MADCREDRSGLAHRGTSQPERRLSALAADYVHVDENRYSDWIVFATEYSKHLKYYDSTTGDLFIGWQSFYARDIAAILGSFAVQNIKTFRRAVRQRLDFLLDDDNATSVDGELKARLSELINGVFTMSAALNDYLLRLPPANPFSATLRRFIKTRLGPAFRRLLTYYKAVTTPAIDLYVPVASNWRILDRELMDAEAVIAQSGTFSAEWWAPPVEAAGDATADASVFLVNAPSPSVFDRVSHAGNHILFSSIFDTYIETFARLIDEAESGLLRALEDDDTHKPHYALFLAFLKLFRNAQGKLNRITQRHLDFYYREVLQLRSKPALPDQAHLVAELANHVEQAALAKGTLFKADKDSEGRDRLYGITEETTFGKAKIAALMAAYRADGDDDRLNEPLRSSKRLFYAPMMDSSDSFGAELETPLGDWHPFLNAKYDANGKVDALRMPPAEIGFAVSSNYLALSEGNRNIKLRIGGADFSSLPTNRLICRLSHAEGWLEKEINAITSQPFPGAAPATSIEVQLDRSDPAISAPTIDVHGAQLASSHPVMQIVLKNEAGVPYAYDALKNIQINQLELAVRVGDGSSSFQTDGLKQLALASSDGNLDPSKPFMPWGARPAPDSAFYVGHPEVFSKKNAQFNLHIAWANRPDSLSGQPGAALQFLQGGVWQGVASAALTGGIVCSSVEEVVFGDDVELPNSAITEAASAAIPYSASAKTGFVRLVLGGDFGQSTYAANYVKWLIGQAKKPDDTIAPPTEPYLPLIDALYLTYNATSDVEDIGAASATREIRFFHIGPFGAAAQESPSASPYGHHLIPQFRLPGQADHVGEWYIGIEGVEPKGSVGILVQALEGSTEPTLPKPAEHVQWSYWASDRWTPFETREYRDGTRQLTQTGILRFAIPPDATLDKGLMPHGKIWLRASVTEAVGAVSRLLAVKAQALHVVFEPHGNAADAMDQPLAAGTISKLKRADARFKGFQQLCSSFGGRPRETGDAFYVRCSERLRHKGRAVTIWDYERLILEAFPELHRVKCLHHTRIEDHPDASLAIHNENLPGYVTVITIPKLAGRNDANPLQPYTHQSLLTKIKDFLVERVSGQLQGGTTAGPPRICVCNPLFEEVQLQFKLQLRQGYDDFTFYEQRLQDELTQFLSPWAYDDRRDLQFGGGIAKSTLVDFIDEREYVDFVTDVVMKQKPRNQPISGDIEIATPTTSRSILVSALATNHSITPHSP